jgi:hypothetical protein
MDSLDKRPKLRKMDVRFGTWNVRSLHRAGSPITVRKIGWGGMGWIDPAQDKMQHRALVNTVMNSRVP